MSAIRTFDVTLEEGEQIDGVDYALLLYTKLMGDTVDAYADHQSAFEEDIWGEFENDAAFWAEHGNRADEYQVFAKVETMWGAETSAVYFCTTEWLF